MYLPRLLILVSIVLLMSMTLSAQDETYVNGLEGSQMQPSAVFEVADESFLAGGDTAPGVVNSHSRLVWTTEPNSDPYELLPEAYQLAVEVQFWTSDDDPGGPPSQAFNRLLTIYVEGESGQPVTYGETAYEFTGARKMRIKLLGLMHNEQPIEMSTLKGTITGELTVSRQVCELNCGSVDMLGDVTFSGYGYANFYIASVPAIECADAYDLEYGFFDEDSPQAQAIGGLSSTVKVDALLRNNATRLTSSSNSFRIFNLYRRGYLLFRYRAVELLPDGRRRYTPWNSHQLSVDDHLEGGNGQLAPRSPNVLAVDHQDNLNWQATNNFAEDAKQLPSVNYLDGTLRSRQTRTVQYLDNAETPSPQQEYVVAQQTLYDGLGRPAGTTLPTPLYLDDMAHPTYIHPVEYWSGNLERTAGGDVYDRTEVETATDCLAPAMGEQSGAGKFYSPANGKARNTYVARGEGYPFSLTRYTPDNTGRVQISGGVGPRLGVGGGHDTRYYYGNVDQTELDGLFGVNAGLAVHYEKTLVVDPNGQSSVSIVDARGRTVATALAGRVEELSDLASGATGGPVETSLLNDAEVGSTRVSTYSLLVTESGPVDICYAMTSAPYAVDGCCGGGEVAGCLDCEYDVTVTITSNDIYDCSDGSVNSQPFVPVSLSATGVTLGEMNNCFGGSSSINYNGTLAVGSYTITKVLRVNEGKLAEDVEAFMETAGCLRPLSEFEAAYRAEVDLSQCANCDCTDLSATDTACVEICEALTPCKQLRAQLYADLRPGGQYALVTPTAGVPITLSYLNLGRPNSETYKGVDFGDIQVLSPAGDLVSPDELTVPDFVDLFTDEWLDYLLPLHPEACLLTYCETQLDAPTSSGGSSSNAFDLRLRSLDTYQEAQSAGVLSSTTSGSAFSYSESNELLDQLVLADPFFGSTTSGLGGAFYASLTPSADNYINHMLYPVTLHALQLFQGSTSQSGTWTVTSSTPSYQLDILWRLVRDLYLSRKAVFVNTQQRASCGSGTGIDCLEQQLCASLPCQSASGCGSAPASNYVAYQARVPDLDRIVGLTTLNQSVADELVQYGQAQNNQYGPGGVHPAPDLSGVSGPVVLSGDELIQWLRGSDPDDLQAWYDQVMACCVPVTSATGDDPDQPDDGSGQSTVDNNCDPFLQASLLENIPYDQISYLYTLIGRYLDEKDINLAGFMDSYTPPSFPVRLPMQITANESCVERVVILAQWDHGNITAGNPIEFAELAAFTADMNATYGWSRTLEDYELILTNSDVCLVCANAPVAPEPPSCTDELLTRADARAARAYADYLEGVEQDLRRDLLAHCLSSPTEKLLKRQASTTFHYTLYYYDQAGNLTMTVPPTGVKPLDLVNNKAQDLADYRTDLTDSRPPASADASELLPRHDFLTEYAYNSFNEIIVSDSPDKEPVRTWYDPLGRAVLSRDGRQSDLGRYSYTRYDALGRVTEVGELVPNGGTTESQLLAPLRLTGGIEDVLTNLTTSRHHVTRSYYTSSPIGVPDFQRDPLTTRNRVTATTYAERAGSTAGEYDYATHYDYDIGGNVRRLVQDFPELADIEHRYKRLEYNYDLLSGNVNSLIYQRDASDQFAYRYEYDRTNRLVAAYSSEIEVRHQHSSNWKRDASYTYYDHGPLRRTVIGQDQLQGVDYAYTLQGWIKGVNGGVGTKFNEGLVDANDQLTARRVWDMNGDGMSANASTTNQLVNRDLYRYQNDYFAGDYLPVGAAGADNPFGAWPAGEPGELFNGNIGRHRKLLQSDGYAHSVLRARYDQLNRLVSATDATRATDNPGQTGDVGAWTNEVRPEYAYDGNGNLLTLSREVTRRSSANASALTGENYLSYAYRPGTNQLLSVTPTLSGNLPAADRPFRFVDQSRHYTYDGAGNLIRQRWGANTPDNPETSHLEWNPYGKVEVVALPGQEETLFGYGLDQNRWTKLRRAFADANNYEETAEYQVRDAQGNTLAVYHRSATARRVYLADQDDDGPQTTGEIPKSGPNDEYVDYLEYSALTWETQYLYGSARLGQVGLDRLLEPNCADCEPGTTNPNGPVGPVEPDGEGKGGEELPEDGYDPAPLKPAPFGLRRYELTNHLGNVLVVFGENQGSSVAELADGSQEEYSHPEVLSSHDYLPFGLKYDRLGGAGELKRGAYRYGFNGKEIDEEGEWGSTTVYDYGFRVYDPGIAKFLSVDPLTRSYPWYTPYQFAGNKPIAFIDLDGLEEFPSYKAYKEAKGDAALEVVDGSDGAWLSVHRELFEVAYDIKYGMSQSDRDELGWHSALGGPFATAARVNLANEASENYQTISQRTNFYRWANDKVLTEGFEVRWPGAAAVVAGNIDMLDSWAMQIPGWTYANDELAEFANVGNRAIFNDALPKLNSLFSGDVLTGNDARVWDMQTLAEEQSLIQPLYQGLSSDSYQLLQNIVRQEGMLGISPMPVFTEDLLNIGDRWKYGLEGAGYENVKTSDLPSVPKEYSDGSQLERVKN